jgi:hypothetical protein
MGQYGWKSEFLDILVQVSYIELKEKSNVLAADTRREQADVQMWPQYEAFCSIL